MNRRDFIKVVGLGTVTLYLSGCGTAAIDSPKNEVSAQVVSGGKPMKIVVIKSNRLRVT